MSLFTTFQIDFYKILHPEAKGDGSLTPGWGELTSGVAGPPIKRRGLLSIQYHTCPVTAPKSARSQANTAVPLHRVTNKSSFIILERGPS